MMRDLASNIALRPVIAPAANANLGSTPLVGSIIDRLGFNSLVYAISTGALTDADATYSVLLEESDAANMAGANPVDDAYLTGTEAAAGFTFANDENRPEARLSRSEAFHAPDRHTDRRQ